MPALSGWIGSAVQVNILREGGKQRQTAAVGQQMLQTLTTLSFVIREMYEGWAINMFCIT